MRNTIGGPANGEAGSRATSAHPDPGFTLPSEAPAHGAPVRQYINTKVTGTLLEGMKLLAKEQCVGEHPSFAPSSCQVPDADSLDFPGRETPCACWASSCFSDRRNWRVLARHGSSVGGTARRRTLLGTGMLSAKFSPSRANTHPCTVLPFIT